MVINTEPKAIGTAILRHQNRNRIFKYIFENKGKATKQLLSTELSLSLPTVSQNLQELANENLIKYSGTTQSTGGRKPRVIDISSNSRYSIGISVTKNTLRIICVNLCVEEKCYKKINVKNIDFKEIGKTLCFELEKFIKENNIKSSKILGVCIAFPGIISFDRNTIETAPTLKLQNFPLEDIYNQIKYPCYIDNDANLGALTEQQSCDNLVYISLDKGVGGAIILNRKAIVGNSGKSAEFGHICLDKSGPVCSCGKKGCLEAFCSTDRLSEDFGFNIEEFFEKITSKTTIYTDVLDRYLSSLAKGINNIHMIMDCDIVLGGTMAQFLEDHLDTIKEKVCEMDAFNKDSDYIRLSKYGSKTTCMGAAVYQIQSFINSI